MKKLFVIALVLIAVPAFAQQTQCYGWEDGGTILGSYGNACCESNVTGPQTGLTGDAGTGTWNCPGAFEGDGYLHVAEDPHSGTPQFYIAWVTGLVEGDNVAASYYGYDTVDEAAGTNGEPALRIWGHYSTNADITVYSGSAGAGNNNTGYTTAVGWQQISADWDIPADKEALVIELRVYSYDYTSDPNHSDYWADYVCVTAPDNATIHFPEGGVPVEDASWGNIKALYR